MQPTAQDRVLWTPETLELVLLQLDLHTLLLAQRTCRFWHSLIRQSPSIQKALFYLPDQPTRPIYNPLLTHAFPSFFPNPKTGQVDAQFTFMTFDMLQHPEKIDAYNREEASWRRMLVKQPPPANFAFCEIVSPRARAAYLNRRVVQVSSGSTLNAPEQIPDERTPWQPRYNHWRPPDRGLRMELLYEFVVTKGPLGFTTENFHRVHWSTGGVCEFASHPWQRNSQLLDALCHTLAKFEIVIQTKCLSPGPSFEEGTDLTIEEKRRRLILPARWKRKESNTLYEMVDWNGGE